MANSFGRCSRWNMAAGMGSIFFLTKLLGGTIFADIFLTTDDAQVVQAATTLIETIEQEFPNYHQHRAWLAVVFLIAGYSSRAWALYNMGKAKPWGIERKIMFRGGAAGEMLIGDPLETPHPEFERATEDATTALAHVKLLEQWTETLGPTSPQRLYVKKLEALLLMQRGVLKKFKRDFGGAVEDLRATASIARRFSFASIEDVQLFTRLGSGEICLGNLSFHYQMALVLQKIAPNGELQSPMQTEPPRPLFTVKESKAIRGELGLKLDCSMTALLNVNNKGMGDADRWSFDHYGIFGTQIAVSGVIRSGVHEKVEGRSGEEWCIIVPSGNGNHFEALSNTRATVVEPFMTDLFQSIQETVFKALGSRKK